MHQMDHSGRHVSAGIDWQPFEDAVGRIALEISEIAVLGCFEPKPISSCYDDELPRTRKAILRARHGKLARFSDHVNRNTFLVACRDYADENPEEHLIIGYGFSHGSTTKVESLHHVLGETGTVRLPEAVGHLMWDFYGHHESNELLIFQQPPLQSDQLPVRQFAAGVPQRPALS